MKSSEIQEELGADQVVLCIKRSQLLWDRPKEPESAAGLRDVWKTRFPLGPNPGGFLLGTRAS